MIWRGPFGCLLAFLSIAIGFMVYLFVASFFAAYDYLPISGIGIITAVLAILSYKRVFLRQVIH